MDIRPIVRPVVWNVEPVAPITPAAIAPVAVQMPVIAVEQATGPPKPRPDPQPNASSIALADPSVVAPRREFPADPDAMERRITIDTATQQVIYQAIDKNSGEVVRQIPEEAMLRLQVYARAMRQAEVRAGAGVELNA